MLQVYTGDGKGKTSAALGVALRASGHGQRTAIVQFLKDDPDYGEFMAQNNVSAIDVLQVGRNEFVNFRQPEQVDLDLAQAGWKQAQELIIGTEYDIVVLDEFTFLVKYNWIDVEEAYAFLEAHKSSKQIIVTGRYATEKLIEIADLVTEMVNVKHYFDRGCSSIVGIDH